MSYRVCDYAIWVTGTSGFIGRALCAELIERGYDVRSANLALGELESTTLYGVDSVIHLAARVHVMHDTTADPLAEFRAANVDVTLNLARQAASVGVRRFVFISSVKVNGESTVPGRAFTEVDLPDPQDAYAQSKYEAEQGLRQISAKTGMEVVIIRPPLVYGPGVKANFADLIRVVQRGWPLPMGAITHNRRSLMGLDNLVDFILTCLAHPAAANQTFLASDGHDLSTTALVSALARAAGVSTHLLPVPVWGLRIAATLVGKGAAVRRLCGSLQVDISKARGLLGWVPPVSVNEGLHRAVAKIGSHEKTI